jgi:hypothetical protein
MKEILEAKLKQFNIWLEDLDMPGYEYTLGQRDFCVELLSKCDEMMYSCHDFYDDYYDDADEFYSDPLEDYYSDLAMYKHEEISDMYNKHYHFSWGLGKNVMNTDSMWFTSDEIEAFREIWQRRISAL